MEIKKLLPISAFCIYFIKVCILPAGIPEASILLILASFVAYLEYKDSDKKLSTIESDLSKLKNDLEEKSKEIDSMKSYVTGMKLQNSMKSTGGYNVR